MKMYTPLSSLDHLSYRLVSHQQEGADGVKRPPLPSLHSGSKVMRIKSSMDDIQGDTP